jgi:hypothetical protein
VQPDHPFQPTRYSALLALAAELVRRHPVKGGYMKSSMSSLLQLITAFLVALFPLSSKSQSLPEPYPYSIGPIRHAQLDPALVDRIRAFEPVFVDLYPINREQWLDGFKRDKDPDREVRIWEEIASALTSFVAGRNLPLAVRREAFALLLVRSSNSEDDVVKSTKLKHLSQDDFRRLLKSYRSQPVPLQVERR